MAIILNIDTSDKNTSVCISKDGELFKIKEFKGVDFSHSEKLHILIKELDFNLNDIDAVSVNKGPGSFTGLRVGSSSAKGICFALNKPIISLNSLEIITNGYIQKNDNIPKKKILFPVIDVRNNTVYKGEYNSKLEELSKVDLIDISKYNFNKEKEYIFIGNEINFLKNLNIKGDFVDHFMISSEYMCKLSEDKFNKKEFENIETFEPMYIKNFIITKSKKSLLK